MLEPNLLAEPLKGKAGEYISKLEIYEQEKLNALKKELWAKRVQVVGALKKEMAKVTKKGDLEGALAIKKEIERLTGEIDLAAINSIKGKENEVAEKAGKKSKSAMRKELEKRLVGTKWKDTGGAIYLFEKRGQLKATMPGQAAQDWEWKVEEPGKVRLLYSNVHSILLLFGEEGESVTKEWYKGDDLLLTSKFEQLE